MRQWHRILAIGVLEAGLAGLLYPSVVWPLLAWISGCTILVAISVGRGFVGLLGKQADGRLPLWSIVLLWPWHAAVRFGATAHRRLVPEPLSTEIHPGWHLGAWPHRRTLWEQWPAIVDCTAELPRRGDPAAPYLCIPTFDGTAPTPAAMRKAVAWVLKQRAEHREVLIHCAHGRGRCATIMSAALVEAGLHEDTRAAAAHLRRCRPSVTINRDQRLLLRDHAARR